MIIENPWRFEKKDPVLNEHDYENYEDEEERKRG